jgi:hypothetical protein
MARRSMCRRVAPSEPLPQARVEVLLSRCRRPRCCQAWRSMFWSGWWRLGLSRKRPRPLARHRGPTPARRGRRPGLGRPRLSCLTEPPSSTASRSTRRGRSHTATAHEVSPALARGFLRPRSSVRRAPAGSSVFAHQPNRITTGQRSAGSRRDRQSSGRPVVANRGSTSGRRRPPRRFRPAEDDR